MEPEDIQGLGLNSQKQILSRDERLALKYANRSRQQATGQSLEDDTKLEQQLETRERMLARQKEAQEKAARAREKALEKEEEEKAKRLEERLAGGKTN